jgi:hypothetical protein
MTHGVHVITIPSGEHATTGTAKRFGVLNRSWDLHVPREEERSWRLRRRKEKHLVFRLFFSRFFRILFRIGWCLDTAKLLRSVRTHELRANRVRHWGQPILLSLPPSLTLLVVVVQLVIHSFV